MLRIRCGEHDDQERAPCGRCSDFAAERQFVRTADLLQTLTLRYPAITPIFLPMRPLCDEVSALLNSSTGPFIVNRCLNSWTDMAHQTSKSLCSRAMISGAKSWGLGLQGCPFRRGNT